MIELFRSDNVVVRSVPTANVSRWVVTFDNYGIARGFDRPAFGEGFLQQSGVSAIHVMGRSEDWYQYPEMAEAMAAVRQATTGADRVMTYGSSMGGYAAIRFADAAGADAALAISPQYSINPDRAPFERRWMQESHRIRWLPEIDGPIQSGCTPIIVFDPTGDDRRHVDLIAAETAITTIDLRHSGHPAATYLSEVGLLGPLVLQALSGALDPAAFRREARRRRAECAPYLSRLAELQPEHRAPLAISLARRANALAPAAPLAMVALASLLTRSGDHEEALALHEAASKVTDRAGNYLVLHAEALVAAGRPLQALVLAREVVEENPQAAYLWAWLGHLEWKWGASDAALAALERAVFLHPEKAEYRMALEHYQASLSGSKSEVVPKGRLVRLLRILKRRLWAGAGP